MSDRSKSIAALSPEQLELLVLQAGKKRRDSAPAAIRPQRRISNTFPVSFAQQRLWFVDQLLPGNSAYNIHEAVHLTGPLDVAALEQSLDEIVRRHESLRTTFTAVDGRPMQVITPIGTGAALPLPLLDLEALPAPIRATRIEELAVAEAQQPFDLARGPLLRAKLLRLADDEHVLLLAMHHIIADSWSLGIFVRELAALYGSFSGGVGAPLPDLPIQYADFAVWQQEEQKRLLEPQLAYWKRQLAGPLPALELPTDRPRPPIQTSHGARLPLSLPAAVREALAALSRQEGVTLFMTLLAAFDALLYRYSGQADVVVGSPIAGRTRPEIEGLIGMFANTLVLRTDLSGNPSFRELLGRVREVCLGAYAHQDLPFERLVEELQPKRDMSRNPLFQVSFVLQNTPMTALQLPGLTSRPVHAGSETALFDLTLELLETAQGLIGSIEYNTDLFDATTIARMADHFQNLLADLVADPDLRVADAPLLTDAERQQLLVDWNSTWTAYPRDACIQELFEAQVERTPDAIALLFDRPGVRGQGSGVGGQRSATAQGPLSPQSSVLNPQHLTYRELNRRANQLAHFLRELGIGPEVQVGICMERSPELVIGLLGILKADAVYVPFDPTYPQERLSFMLNDTGVPVLLTQERLMAELPAHSVHLLCLDADWGGIAQEPANNLPSRTVAENLAYVMYTSGSTGQPKGASITHRSVVRLVVETNYASFGADEVFLQLAPIAFDASTFEIWGSLLHGARLVIFPPHAPTLEELGASLQRFQVTTLWLTAGLFHQMIESQLASLGRVRQLLAGGDVLSVAHIQKVLQTLDGGRLINGYGPTESTTFTCCYPMSHPDQVGRTASIGQPIANTQVYVLDARMRPVPIGVVGELYIGGDGLARGYLNRPDLTAESFIPNPFASAGDKETRRQGDWGAGTLSRSPISNLQSPIA